MLRTSVFIRRRRNEPIGKCGPGRRSMRLAVGVSVVLVTLLAAACGSSDESALATAPTAAATSAPVASVPATSAPEPSATPEPTPEFVPGPREAEFADGRFKINFLCRSDPELAAGIDVVDVESILGPELERIASLIDGEKQVINIRGPVSSTLLTESRARLESEGYVTGTVDDITHRINLFINPDGPIGMEDFWRVIVPSEVANGTYFFIRFREAAGTYYDSLLDSILLFGLSMAFQQEVFPDLEEQLRELRPEFAAVIYDLSPEGEAVYWTAAQPDLDIISQTVFARFLEYSGGTGEFPAGAGTAVGLRIVQAYQANNPGVTASSLLRVPPEEIFEGSNYNP